MADAHAWPALVVRSARPLTADQEGAISASLDDHQPTAIQDLAEIELPRGLWDPDAPPPPDARPAPLHWRVFFASPDDRDAAAETLQTACPWVDVTAEDVADEDWAARSQRQLTAIHAGRFVVAPPWDVPPESGALRIIVEPSRGFGTGHHPSTRLCLRALSETEVDGRRVLDLGTGSGVLAMAARLAGAGAVTAVDIDADAIESARQSAALNAGMDSIEWLVGDFRDATWSALSGRTWDLVLGNLTGAMLQRSAARIANLLAPGGLLVASGFVQEELSAVEAAFGGSRVAILHEDEWVGLILSPVGSGTR